MNKIIKQIELLKKTKKIGLCHGAYDVVHIGHIKHFNYCKKFCDILIVSVTDDKFIKKGFDRPIFDIQKRIEFLSNISSIDFVIRSDEFSAVSNIKLIKPHIYFKGSEYKKKDLIGNLKKEINTLKKIGSTIYYTKGFSSSSSKIINKYFSNNLVNNSFISEIKKKFSYNFIEKKIDFLKKISPLIIGEIIIDQYTLSETIGKSGKDPYLVTKYLSDQKYLGGVGAIANTISSFTNSIQVLSYIGKKNSYSKFIDKKLNKNIRLYLITKKNSDTILKKRYVENYDKTKILGVYHYNDDPLDINEEKKLINKLKKLNIKSKTVIVADYGHGLITNNISKFISNESRFLSINCQINASNYGEHSLLKYKKCNLIVINERELRYELRDKNSSINILISRLKKIIKFKSIIVTRGKYGAQMFVNNKSLNCPAFTETIKDKVGAGDAMFALASVCDSMNFEPEITLLIGSIASYYNLGVLGNESNIDVNYLKKIIYQLLQ